MNRKVLLVGLFILMACLGAKARAQSPEAMGIEELMREIQVRRAYFGLALINDWPERCCDPGPSQSPGDYPPDGFYRYDDLDDLDKARLVEFVSDKMAEMVTATHFLTPSGIAIEGSVEDVTGFSKNRYRPGMLPGVGAEVVSRNADAVLAMMSASIELLVYTRLQPELYLDSQSNLGVWTQAEIASASSPQTAHFADPLDPYTDAADALADLVDYLGQPGTWSVVYHQGNGFVTDAKGPLFTEQVSYGPISPSGGGHNGAIFSTRNGAWDADIGVYTNAEAHLFLKVSEQPAGVNQDFAPSIAPTGVIGSTDPDEQAYFTHYEMQSISTSTVSDRVEFTDFGYYELGGPWTPVHATGGSPCWQLPVGSDPCQDTYGWEVEEDGWVGYVKHDFQPPTSTPSGTCDPCEHGIVIFAIAQPAPDTPGSGGISGPGGRGTSGDDDPADDVEDCESDGEATEGETGGPIVLASGHKIERATDLVVALPGMDFKLVREYTSQPDFHGVGVTGGLVGENWTMSAFQRLYGDLETDGAKFLYTGTNGRDRTYTETGASSGIWSAGGPTSQYMVPETLDVDGTDYRVWRLISPGNWEIDYYRETSSVSGFADVGAELAGHILQVRDAWGNPHHYEYKAYDAPSSATTYRLDRIILHSTPAQLTQAAALVEFSWHLIAPVEQYHNAANGRLAGVFVTRPDGVVTQVVDYYYYDQEDGISVPVPPCSSSSGGSSGFMSGCTVAHLGSDGDLIQVVKRVRTDAAIQMRADAGILADDQAAPWRVLIWQYRYHYVDPIGDETAQWSGVSGLSTSYGYDHQLRMIIQPEQIEEVYRQLLAAGVPVDDIEVAASQLLHVEDASAIPATATGTLSIRPIDVAMKLIGYRRAGVEGDSRVLTQWLSAGCGCSGSTNGKRLTYTYHDSWTGGQSVHIDEHMYTTSFTPFRAIYYDLVTSNGVEYLRTKAVKDTRITTPGPGEAPGRTWVWEFTRGGSDDTLVRIATPSAVDSATTAYVPASGSTAPTWPSGIAAGLVYGYVFDANNRITERRISDGVQSTIGDMDLLSTTTYASGARSDLPTSVKRFRAPTTTTSVAAADVEETIFSYEFHDVDDKHLAFVIVSAERELVAENGPGSPDTEVESIELFAANGLNEWSVAADGTLTRRQFDENTGRVTTLTRNADIADFVGSNYGSPTTTGWGKSGQRLSWHYVRDKLGRQIQGTAPGGAKSYTRRTMLPGDLGLASGLESLTPDVNPVRGVELYVEVTLPQDLGESSGVPAWERSLRASSYTAPAMVRWYNAAGKLVRSGEFYVGTTDDSWSAYVPSSDVYSVRFTDGADSTDLARAIHEINLIGQRTESHVWHRIEATDAPAHYYTTAYAYDEVGRLQSVTDPTGTITTTPAFDIWDRPLSRQVGTSAGSTVVEEVFYDSSSASQGVGNGTVTRVRRFTGEASPLDARDEIRTFDYRDRLIVVESELPPHQLVVYDNLDRVVERGLFSSVQTTMSTTDRVSHEIMHYSQRGLMYRTQKAIDPASGSSAYLESHQWFDEVGRSIASWGPNSPATKVIFDALSRPTTVYVSDRGGDALPGASGNWNDAATINGDRVIEQIEYTYNDFGSAASVTSRQRPHDAGTATGALTGSSSISSYVFMEYDDAGRQVATVDFGTGASSGLFEETTSAPAAPGSAFDASGDPQAISGALVSRVYFDRRGLIGQKVSPDLTYTQFAYDALRRRIATIENYTDVEPTEIVWNDTDGRWEVSVIGTGGLSTTETDLDRVTSFVYDGASQLVRRVAHFVEGSAEAVQQTKYEYGVTKPSPTTPTSSLVNSNRLLYKVHYPDETTGEPGGSPSSAAYQVTYAYNVLGELRAYIDQNGTTHEYSRDALGRVTANSVTSIPAHIDDDIERIEVSYDTAGRVDKVTSRVDATGGAAANEVQFTYTPLWQIDEVRQSYDGEIGSGTVRTIGYDYANQGVATGNYSRSASMDYPSGTELHTAYAASGSLDDRISRPRSLTYRHKNQSGLTANYGLVEYDYIGMGRVAITDYVGIDVQLDRTVTPQGARTSGVYPGWDQWGRVRLHQWVDGGFGPHGTTSGFPDRPQIFAEQYGYDDDSNRTFKHDVRDGVSYAGNSWSFLYDGLDRLKEAVKGDWAGTFASVAGGQAWDLDVLGNWDSFTVDTTGDGFFGAGDSVEDRNHNLANEITDNGGTPSIPFVYDDAGNTEEYPASSGNAAAKYQLKYDAWNRLVQVKIVENLTTTPVTTTLAEQEYNGLHWRTVVRRDTDVPVDGLDQMRVLSYDASWRLVEEQVDDGWSSGGGGFTADRSLEQFWGLRYIDDPILRRTAPGAVGGYWHVTDVQFSTMALLDNNAKPYERVWYTPYGEARHHWGQDFDGDRDFDSADTTALLNKISGGSVPITDTANYDVEYDLNRDGTIDFNDLPSGSAQTAVPLGQLGRLDGVNTGPDNWIGYAGYVWEGASSLYHVRHRSYSSGLGRWMQRDPAGYVDGMGLYEYTRSSAPGWVDPFGLCTVEVRYNAMRSTSVSTWYHAYIVVIDDQGDEYYFRGGPAGSPNAKAGRKAISPASVDATSESSGSDSCGCNPNSGSNSDSAGTSGSASDSQSADACSGSRRTSYGWGPISINHGEYVAGTPDWVTHTVPRDVVQNTTGLTCEELIELLKEQCDELDEARTPYFPTSTNSNATAREILENAGLQPPLPTVWVPGWNTTIETPAEREARCRREESRRRQRRAEHLERTGGGYACFVAGTSVVDSNGRSVEIQNIKVGSMLVTTHAASNRRVVVEVERVIESEATSLIHIQLPSETIRVTAQHPFLLGDGQWTRAGRLVAGSKLVSVYGGYVTVQEVSRESLGQPIRVYTLSVSEPSSFAVGADGVVVHNK